MNTPFAFPLSLLLILSLLLGSCKAYEEDDLLTNETGIDSSLEGFFNTFKSEAEARDFFVTDDFNGISAALVDIPEQDVVGYCYAGGGQNNRIEIDRDFWNSASHAIRELVVFHELGHCYLDRDHDNQEAGGICLSIMAAGNTGCTEAYTQQREYYLDELFDPSSKNRFPL